MPFCPTRCGPVPSSQLRFEAMLRHVLASWDASLRTSPQELDVRALREQLAAAQAGERHIDGCNEAAGLDNLGRCRASMACTCLRRFTPCCTHMHPSAHTFASTRTSSSACMHAWSKSTLGASKHDWVGVQYNMQVCSGQGPTVLRLQSPGRAADSQ